MIAPSQSRVPTIRYLHEEATSGKSKRYLNSKGRYIEFKYLYFRIQQQINKDVLLSFKYEQLKTPELRVSLIKPLVSKIIEISNTQNLKLDISNQLCTTPGSTTFETPLFGPVNYGSLPADEESAARISSCVIYVFLLLRYEFMIQSENHLIMYDLLVTKATICELLAIRLLREYSSSERINLLFINPMAHHDEHVQLRHTKHLDSFNTLELSILSKSKKFLVQPVIISILDRIYNGELIMKDRTTLGPDHWSQYPSSSDSRSRTLEGIKPNAERGLINDLEHDPFDFNTTETQHSEDYEKNVVNYRFQQITIKKVFVRSNVVPKYQSLVINLKYAFLTLLFLNLVFKHKYGLRSGYLGTSFWIVALSFNFDVIVKSLHIEFRFLKKIIWTYVDILIVLLIDLSLVMRILLGLGRIENQTYYSCFSLISILLFPRMLSVFNNYEFFNMIIVSLKKMTWNVIAMSCLFTSLIFGFFLCFISLTIDMSTYEVAFAMVKLFFGFTPAVWDNWESFDHLGRALQLSYLSLIQFVFATILAIVLSNVFAKVSESNKEEFEYLKTTNLIIYLKWASFKQSGKSESRLTIAFDYAVKAFKLPIILVIYFYEILIKDNKLSLQKQRKDLKHFTFLNREEDLNDDPDMAPFYRVARDEEIYSLRLSSRRCSQTETRVASGGEAGVSFTNPKSRTQKMTSEQNFTHRKLEPQYSQATMAGFRSGSLDSMFIDDYFGKRYGHSGRRLASEGRSRRTKSESEPHWKLQALNEEILQKLSDLEEKLALLSNMQEAVKPNKHEVRAYWKARTKRKIRSDEEGNSIRSAEDGTSYEDSSNSENYFTDLDQRT